MKKHNILPLLFLCTACESGVTELALEQPSTSAADSIEIHFNVGGVYTPVSKGGTRSLGYHYFDQITPQALPEGTSLWLLIEEIHIDGTDTTYVSKDLNTAYSIVNRLDAETNTYVSDLIPCTVDDDGNVLELTGTSLFMREGMYRFKALWPALKLQDVTTTTGEGDNAVTETLNNVLTISNGMQVISNDDNFEMTRPTIVSVESNGGISIQTIQLNSMVNQTAHMEFEIEPQTSDGSDTRIFSIEPMKRGCEITGLQKEDAYNWTQAGLQLHSYINKKTEKWAVDENDFYRGTDESLTKLYCGLCVLPTDARSSSIFVVFNLRVNGIPTQYQTAINNTVLEQGYNYRYNVKISIDGGITVANWANSSNSVSVEMSSKE